MSYGVFDRGPKKHDGSLLLIGVNTFLPKDHGDEIANIKCYAETRNALASDSLWGG